MRSVRPLKRVAHIGFSSADKKTVEGETAVRLCNYTDVYYNERITDDLSFMAATATDDQIEALELRAGDVLLTKDSETPDDIGVSSLVVTDLPGVLCGYHLALIRPDPGEVDSRYLRWALSATASRQQLEVAAAGITRFGLRYDAVAGMSIPVPSLPEQRAIADYLDAETARIDRVLRVRRRFVAVLEQRRAVVISEAVSGRLRVTDSFDGSATPRPLRAYAEVALGRARSPGTAEGEDMLPYLRAANVKDGQLDLSSVLEMNFTPEEQRRYALIPGDVLVTEGAGSLAAVGATATWHGEIAGTVCFQNHLLRIRATARSDARFFAWWARFAYESGLFGSIATGAQILNLGAEHVRSLPVKLPEMGAQRAIANYLDRMVGAIETLIGTVKMQVDLLLERRQALITAAVTGQVEVPGVAV